MELINWVLTGLLTALLGLYFIKARQLDKFVEHQHANVNDLVFRHNEGIEFLEYQFAKFNYQILAQKNQLKFNADSSLAEVLRHKGARDVLVKSKLIKKKDDPINDESLAKLARDLNIELDPILVKLNMLEI
jgi:hypothetical protein